jgi:hypothetical protein
MRVDFDKNFADIEDRHRELLRRIRNHDDRLDDIEQRLSRLER